MKILAVILLAVGAIISYLSKFIFKAVTKNEATDEQSLKVKLLGVAVFTAGLVLTVIYFR